VDRPRRSAAPWLFGIAVLLTLLAPLVFLGVWVGAGTVEGFGVALLAAIADLVAAAIAAITATVLAVRRGVTRIRTVVHGHPQGRVGRMAEHDAARWRLARRRFAELQAEYAAFEADRFAVAARPALADVTVPATARFVQALGDAEFLVTDEEPAGPRRAEFAAAVDRAVEAWENAQRVAEGLAQARREQGGVRYDTRAVDPAPPRVHHTAMPGAPTTGERPASEYAQAADAVRRAAARGARDLRDRLRA
jgi:hypothetical protein